MSYDHTNSDYEGGDSLSQSDSSHHSASASRSSNQESHRAGSPANASAKMHQCSKCGASFERSQSRHMPFCSKRCQEIDLGMWLNESYGFPYEGDESSGNQGVSVDDNDA